MSAAAAAAIAADQAKLKTQVRFTEEQRIELDNFYKKYSDQAEGLKNSNPGLCELSCRLRLSKKQIKTYCRNKKYFEVEKEKKMTENAMKIKQAFGTVGQDVDIEDSKVISNLISSRFKWTPKMHEIFLKAIDNLKEEATPSRILSYIKQANVKGEFEPGIDISNLNRFHVTSHLQQFRNNQRKNLMSLGSEGTLMSEPGSDRAVSFMLNSIQSSLRKFKDEDHPSKNTISTQTSEETAAANAAAAANNANAAGSLNMNSQFMNPNNQAAAMTYPSMHHGMQFMGLNPYQMQYFQQQQQHQQQHQHQQNMQNQMMMHKSIFNMPTTLPNAGAANGATANAATNGVDNHVVMGTGHEFPGAMHQFNRPGYFQPNFMKPQEVKPVTSTNTAAAVAGNGVNIKEEMTSLEQHDFKREEVVTEPISNLQDHIFSMLDKFNGKVLAVLNPEDIEIMQNEDNEDEVTAVIKDGKFLTCLKNLKKIPVKKRKLA